MTTYTIEILGSFTTLDELLDIAPLEENVPEISLMQLDLHYETRPTDESLAELATLMAEAGIPQWSIDTPHVSLDESTNVVHITWVKGFAWTPVIVGLIGLVILPVLLGGFLLWIIPDELINMISSVIMIVIMMKIMGPMMSDSSKKDSSTVSKEA